jgi:hypothetical protein
MAPEAHPPEPASGCGADQDLIGFG